MSPEELLELADGRSIGLTQGKTGFWIDAAVVIAGSAGKNGQRNVADRGIQGLRGEHPAGEEAQAEHAPAH